MIIILEGGLGSGKTLMMSRYLRKDYQNGNKIMANYDLFGIKYDKLNVANLMHDEDIENVSIGIDEITVFMDCRTSTSRMNRFLSYFVLQTRKRNVNLYATTQDIDMVDYRITRHAHFNIICVDIGHENYRKYTIIDSRTPRDPKLKRFIMDISKYFGTYDTDQRIYPPIKNISK